MIDVITRTEEKREWKCPWFFFFEDKCPWFYGKMEKKINISLIKSFTIFTIICLLTKSTYIEFNPNTENTPNNTEANLSE